LIRYVLRVDLHIAALLHAWHQKLRDSSVLSTVHSRLYMYNYIIIVETVCPLHQTLARSDLW